ncbi:MAG: GTP-binding protein [Parvibaculaceae bacterium]
MGRDGVEKPIPVVLVTGFLGSGKTTLLQRILNLPQLANTAVIVNEFGEVGIDHHLVRQVAENVVLLPNGCLCCKVRDDLGVTMRELHAASQSETAVPLERLLIETTGLADPVPIVHTLMTDPVVDRAFSLRTIIAVVDAINGEHNLSTHQESARQVAIADRLVITKTDIADGKTVAALIPRLRQINPAAMIDEAQSPAFDPSTVFADQNHDLQGNPSDVRSWIKEGAYRGGQGGGHRHARHAENIGATCVVFDKPLEWTAFTVWLTMLLHSQGKDLLRIKGLLNIEGQSGPVVFQGVQHAISPPVHMPNWPDGDRRSRLVFIAQGVEPEKLRQSLLIFDRAAKFSRNHMPLKNKTIPTGVGTEVEGRPFRRVGGLSWMK